MSISDRIKQRMAALGLKGVDITRATGVSSGGVSQWMSGMTKPSGVKVFSLAKVLKCDPQWLMQGEDKGDQVPTIDASCLGTLSHGTVRQVLMKMK
ncbi:helix-turn-helix domain-containing protein [Veronia nyctiphanis]|uniref:helix-turn-helix domain-containing protein n=1 Tax=Veronia nyctiphanis TaxID=1278244 RepID=UPI002E25925B